MKSISRQVDVAEPTARAVDQMDAGLDLLFTAETALRANGWIDQETITAVSNTIHQALKQLRPVREVINDKML